MSVTIDNLSFAKNWTNDSDFPTYEGSEDRVRADLQYHPNALRDFINNQILPALNALIEGGYSPGAVDTAAIQDGAVTSDKLATPSVVTAAIADEAVTIAKMAADSVDTDQIVAGAVKASKIYDGAVGTLALANASVTNDKLGTDIVPESVGFVVGIGDPMDNPGLLSEGQVYLKLES